MLRHTEPEKTEEPKVEEVKENTESIETEGVTKSYKNTVGPYVEVEGRHMHENVARHIFPTIDLSADTDGGRITTKFGTKFPDYAQTGDIFTRVDIMPNRVYKFNGKKWIDVDKSITDTYLSTTYIQFLVDKISTGEYDPELLSDAERDSIEQRLKNNPRQV